MKTIRIVLVAISLIVAIIDWVLEAAYEIEPAQNFL